jgi:hypothetical protein
MARWRVTKRTRASKRATNHFILNWNKMFERRGWRAAKRARTTAARAMATRARDGDKGDGNGDNVGDGDGDEGGG